MEICRRHHGLGNCSQVSVGASMLQDTIHDVLRWSNDNRFKLNSLKCKELRIDFRKEINLDTVSLKDNGNIMLLKL